MEVDINEMARSLPSGMLESIQEAFGSTIVVNTDVPLEVITEDVELISDVEFEEDYSTVQPTPEPVTSIVKEEEVIVPTLSKNLDTTIRFSGADWFNHAKAKNVIIAGLGGIGSWCVIPIARVVYKIKLVDPDKFEAVNMGGQLCPSSGISNWKTNVLSDIARVFSDVYTETISGKIEDNYYYLGLAKNNLICGFDKMSARKAAFEEWKNHIRTGGPDKKDCIFIDGRLAAERFQIFTFTGEDDFYMKEYETKYLFSDAEADVEVCSYKQTTHIAQMIGSFIATNFINYCVNGSPDNPFPRPIPFIIEYDAITGVLRQNF